MTNMADMNGEALLVLERELTRDFNLQKSNKLSLDLTRGKPAPDQLALSDAMNDILAGDYFAADGTDTRNYGALRGLPEARALGAEIMETPVENVICHGNSSLTLMYIVTETALRYGLWGDERRWDRSTPIKVLTPVPGFDRHFTLCQSLGIEMINVPMTDTGPDMEEVHRHAAEDDSIKGIWCVPKYANPYGCIYSDECVSELARLPATSAADDFVVFWDNAYAVHDFQFPRAPLASIANLAHAAGTGWRPALLDRDRGRVHERDRGAACELWRRRQRLPPSFFPVRSAVRNPSASLVLRVCLRCNRTAQE